jgi:hypothetical protein
MREQEILDKIFKMDYSKPKTSDEIVELMGRIETLVNERKSINEHIQILKDRAFFLESQEVADYLEKKQGEFLNVRPKSFDRIIRKIRRV